VRRPFVDLQKGFATLQNASAEGVWLGAGLQQALLDGSKLVAFLQQRPSDLPLLFVKKGHTNSERALLFAIFLHL